MENSEWMVDSYEKFKDPSLPEKKYFYWSLKDGKRDKSNGHICDEQYQQLENVWDTFNFNTFEDFPNHYLKKDVLLWADVFEKFIFTCLKYYDLDLCYYFSAPGFSWDAMLKVTGVTLEKKVILINTCFFNKEWEAELVILIKDIAKHLKVSVSFIWTWIIYMDVLWGNIYLLIIVSGPKTLIKSNKN